MNSLAKQCLRSISSVALLVAMVLFLAVSTPCMLYAQTADRNGYIDVLSAELRNSNEQLQLHADIELALPREIRQGLDSGVPLHFIVEFRLMQPRDFFPDKRLYSLVRRYTLIYYELTRHYRVHSVESDRSKNYRSLSVALNDLGNIKNIEVEYPAEFAVADTLDAYLRMRLDGRALPLPLQPVFSSTWRLASEEFTWSLN